MEINLSDNIRSDIVGNCVINEKFWTQHQAEQLECDSGKRNNNSVLDWGVKSLHILRPR